MKGLELPVSAAQVWLFMALALLFFVFLIRAASRRASETGAKTDNRSRIGIILQSVGIGLAGFGPPKATLPSLSLAGLAGSVGVLVLMTGAIGLFVASSGALGRNWSVVARMRSDHELVRNGPYAYIRHPIYVGLMLFMFALAVALGHWLNLLVAVPLFLFGTRIRTRIEDELLEAKFGDAFRDYARKTPALLPKIG